MSPKLFVITPPRTPVPPYWSPCHRRMGERRWRAGVAHHQPHAARRSRALWRCAHARGSANWRSVPSLRGGGIAMRDPNLIVRAQQAAAELERAWDRWRSLHGLGIDPPPPVSSYVGYSLEEPWGQPRVVFGIDAR